MNRRVKASAVLLMLAAAIGTDARAQASNPPRLAVMIVVDQLEEWVKANRERLTALAAGR